MVRKTRGTRGTRARRNRKKSRKTRQRGGSWLAKKFWGELTNDQVLAMLDDNDELPEPNQLIDQIFNEYVVDMIPEDPDNPEGPNRLKDEFRDPALKVSDSTKAKLIPYYKEIIISRRPSGSLRDDFIPDFLNAIKEGLDTNNSLVKTKEKFTHLITFREQLLKAKHTNNTGAGFVGKHLSLHFNITDDVSKNMKLIRLAIQAAKSTPVSAPHVE